MSLLPLYMVNFVSALGFSLVLPHLVFWLADFGGSPALYGILGATYSAFQFIGAPILGKASDRFGRKKTLFLTQLGTLSAWIGILIALTIPQWVLFEWNSAWLGPITGSFSLILLFLARSFDGFTAGNISIANAYLSDVSSSQDKAQNFGKMSAASSIGFTLGPSISGVLPSDLVSVVVAIFISVAGLALIHFGLKEPRGAEIQADPCGSQLKRMVGNEMRDCNDRQESSLSGFLHRPKIPFLFLLYFLIYLGFNLFYATFPMLAKNTFEWSPKSLGYFFSVLSLVMVLVQFFLLPFLSARFSPLTLFVGGCLFLAANMGILFSLQDWVWLVPIFFALGNGIMWPTYMAILSEQGTAKDQGSLQGYGSSFGSLASIFGLIFGALIFANLGSQVFLWSSLIFLLISGLGFFLPKVSQLEAKA